jgi:ADP-heptose:LPS heptosyltransferase
MLSGTGAQIAAGLPAAVLVGLLQDAQGYVGVDCGITHIACHLDIPAVVIGHVANIAWMPYYGPHTRVILGAASKEDPYAATRELPISAIIETLRAVLGSNRT